MSLKCSKHGRSFFSKINWRERDRKIYRLCLILLVIFNLGAVGAWYWQHMDSKVPDHIYLFQNQNVEIDFSVPLEGALPGNKGCYSDHEWWKGTGEGAVLWA